MSNNINLTSLKADPPTKQQDRLTLVLMASLSSVLGTSKSKDCRVSTLLQSVEQPYEREIRVSVNSGWVPLDFGWLNGISGLVIIENANTEGNLYLSFSKQNEEQWIVRPKMFFIGEPESKLYYKFDDDSGLVRLFVFAK